MAMKKVKKDLSLDLFTMYDGSFYSIFNKFETSFYDIRNIDILHTLSTHNFKLDNPDFKTVRLLFITNISISGNTLLVGVDDNFNIGIIVETYMLSNYSINVPFTNKINYFKKRRIIMDAPKCIETPDRDYRLELLYIDNDKYEFLFTPELNKLVSGLHSSDMCYNNNKVTSILFDNAEKLDKSLKNKFGDDASFGDFAIYILDTNTIDLYKKEEK